MKFILPSLWQPDSIDDLIGESRRVGQIVAKKIERLAAHPAPVLKHLFYGEPGTGKSSLAKILARQIAGDFGLEHTCGQDVTVDTVRAWERDLGMPSLFGGWQVKHIEEVDTMPPAAQTRLLLYLDKLPPFHAFIGTSNVDIDGLQERFQTRLQPWKIIGPETEDIIIFLRRHWPELTLTEAKSVAVGCGGNVRAACLDAESILDVKAAA